MFSKILVGTDGSEAAVRALEAATDLASQCGASLTIINVPRADTIAFATGAMAGYHMVTTLPSDEQVRAAAEKTLTAAAEVVTARGGTVAAREIRRGEPADEIVAYAQKEGVDCIVTGRRGLGNLMGLVLGSTSQRIAHIAPCAVLSVP